MHIKPGQLADGVLGKRGLVKEMLKAVEKNAELRSPVAEVIVADDLVSEKTQQARQGVADNRAAQVADVHRLGDIRAAEIDDVSLCLRQRRDPQARIAGDLPNQRGQPISFEANVDKARTRNDRCLKRALLG